MSQSALVIFGSQLFPDIHLKPFKGSRIFMAEDEGLCTYFRFHKHKLVLFLSAMRHRYAELKKAGFQVDYHFFERDGLSYEERLGRWIKNHKIQVLHFFEIEDRPTEARIKKMLMKIPCEVIWHRSPMFLTTREEFASYLEKSKKPFMKTFYEWQRRRLGILIDAKKKPIGGQWSFDAENRKRLPKSMDIPDPPFYPPSATTKEVIQVIESFFSSHPGDAKNFWLPVTRQQSLHLMEAFFEEKLENFGPYEDAITTKSGFVFHSVLSSAMNLGLITPDEVVAKSLKYFDSAPLSCLEGFIRQIIGWREFIRGIDRFYGEKQEKSNFFGHTRRLKESWYSAKTGIPPLDGAIRQVNNYGFTHHIERLMVLSNLMLLTEISPLEVYRWFMEMFVDSSDWVMGPNVYGMGQFSDGGIFATKPYICGSNYICKMSDYERGSWELIVDGLYWRFIDRHRDFFIKNHRSSLAVKQFDKIPLSRKQILAKEADRFIELHTEV